MIIARAVVPRQTEPAQEPQAAVGQVSLVGEGSAPRASASVDFDYDSFTEAFSYANGYHRLLTMVQKRYVHLARTNRARGRALMLSLAHHATLPPFPPLPLPLPLLPSPTPPLPAPLRMAKEDVLRICKAWTSFRPNFLSITKNLSPADLVFAEKCFQRTKIEFSRLLNYIGTPTCVWRRTGEIAVVGKEFTLLTDWTPEAISSRNMIIYEVVGRGRGPGPGRGPGRGHGRWHGRWQGRGQGFFEMERASVVRP